MTGFELLSKHDTGDIADMEFLKAFGKQKVFYSTPFGDHVDGSKRLFLIPTPNGKVYNPVFTTTEQATEHYKKVGRNGFLLMEGPFVDFLATTIKVNRGKIPQKMGVIIEPEHFGVTIDANMLGQAVAIIEDR